MQKNKFSWRKLFCIGHLKAAKNIEFHQEKYLARSKGWFHRVERKTFRRKYKDYRQYRIK